MRNRCIDIASGKIEVLRFFNWQVAFPGVWSEWESAGLNGGFDAVIGNPPWDRMKLQQVEWFAARRRQIALAQRAADRKRMIVDLEKAGDQLARDFAEANERATAAVRLARGGGDYPLAVQRRYKPLFALCRAGHDHRKTGRHGRASHPVGHRLRQDSGAVLQGRVDPRKAAGTV